MFASRLHGWLLPQLRQTPSDLRQLVVGHSFPCAAYAAPRLVEGQQPLRDFIVADAVQPAICIEDGRVESLVRQVGSGRPRVVEAGESAKKATACFDDLRCWQSLPPHSAIALQNAS